MGSFLGLPSAPRNLTQSRHPLLYKHNKHNDGIFCTVKNEGPLRGQQGFLYISYCSFISALAFPSIPSKFLKFHPVLFSVGNTVNGLS
ncbi:MAG: hypothetical protein DMG49_06085 [Acidobacteria bacterium]|nr:MAG: hypothetical protein DMG49_06085 [Acidobacteriota bacterium]